MTLALQEFSVPANRAATAPPEARGLARDEVRMLVSDNGTITHARFRELPRFLRPGDLVAVNNSATLSAAVDARYRDRPAVLHFATWLDDGGWVVELRSPRGVPFTEADPEAGARIQLPAATATLRAPWLPPARRLWIADVDTDVPALFICEYDDTVKYQFITEELFGHEMDNIRIKGMTNNFIYEEFHANHDYDLRNASVDFTEDLLKRQWTEEFCGYKLCKTVTLNGKEYDRHNISESILLFQEGHKSFEIEQNIITEVNFNLEEGDANVSIQLTYKVQLADGTYNTRSGKALIQFKYDGDYWSISGFSLPGL